MNNNDHFRFDLRRLRREQARLEEQLHNLEIANGILPINDGEDYEGGNEGGGGGNNEGGGEGEVNPLIYEIQNSNVDEQGENAIRGALYDNRNRQIRQENEALRTERKREAVIAAEQEQQLERNELEKIRIENQLRDFQVQDSERELQTVNLKLIAERQMRLH